MRKRIRGCIVYHGLLWKENYSWRTRKLNINVSCQRALPSLFSTPGNFFSQSLNSTTISSGYLEYRDDSCQETLELSLDIENWQSSILDREVNSISGQCTSLLFPGNSFPSLLVELWSWIMYFDGHSLFPLLICYSIICDPDPDHDYIHILVEKLLYLNWFDNQFFRFGDK